MGSVEAALEIDPPTSRPSSGKAHEYERIVALKRLLPDAARDKRRVDMFLREARLAAMLDHPNVVTAYDYGEIDGELYLAMEYVEGQSLSRMLAALKESGETLPPEIAAYILSEVCRGLHAAHELTDPATSQPLNLVHRDVSPQNVMLAYDGSVRLLDFGVAKIETENVTKTGEVKGKTAYMSPEQAMGDAIDRRSDLFGVGAILFECLALKRMWGDGTDMEVIRKLALEEPPRLDEAGASALPDGLTELHAKLVAREAKNRPKAADEVADALLRFVGDQEAARAKLRDILDAHFAEQARAQRARLTSTLHEVAPEQADELRESVLPTSAVTPISRLRHEDEPAPASKKKSADDAPVVTPPPGSTRAKIGLGALGLVMISLVAWKVMTGDGATTTTTTTTATAPSVTASTRPSASVSAAPSIPTAADSAPAPITSAKPRTPPSIPAPPTTTVTARSAATATTPSATPKPSASVKPPQLDDKPF